jgi:hypothetical protein
MPGSNRQLESVYGEGAVVTFDASIAKSAARRSNRSLPQVRQKTVLQKKIGHVVDSSATTGQL